MLNRLFIKNYALIENLDIQFDAGLNIITGETGAGKSIIMGALGLILGNRAEGRHFFRNDQKCVIEGYFDIAAYDLKSYFQEHDLDYESETIIRRELSVDGKSRSFINDSPVTLNVLRSLGEKLIDIHSQHATLQINTEQFQLLLLDSVAKNSHIHTEYNARLKDYKKSVQALHTLEETIQQTNLELDFNQFQYDELAQANLIADEQQDLEQELNQLENAEEIKRGLLAAFSLLDEQDRSIVEGLKEVTGHLQNVGRYLGDAKGLSERLNSVWIEVKDIAAEVEQMGDEVQMDESRLSFLNERLSTLYNLQKKHKVECVSELIALRDELEQKILAVNNREERLVELKETVNKNKKKLELVAETLTESRQAVVDRVEKHVEGVLSEVGMENARLKIQLNTVSIDKFKTSGADHVAFLFSANKGQELQPIDKVASGGELSRVMLAMKSLVAETSSLPTIIFDEIDTGISGEVALKVGEIMERLSTNMQVLAISHLPQIASKGNAHFKVFKQDDDDRTTTAIVLLNREDRVVEIAQMLSGANPGESALQHARELITNR